MRSWLALCALLAAASPAAAQSSFDLRILAAHNTERARARVGPLVWDPAIAAGAKAHADWMARSGQFAHSDRRTRRGLGENLWWGGRGAFSPEQMVAMWAAERRNFTGGIFPNVSRTGQWFDISHYSQLIWPTTTRLGCGFSRGRVDVLVCRYGPAGNIDGRRVP
ncbi:MAG: CAP domain-containing protein [Sphingomicrobium sp.]